MKLRVGIAGFGVVGKRRLKCLESNPFVEVVAVCDQVFPSDSSLVNGYKGFNNHMRLLEESLDILIVCLTNDIAPDVTIAALKKGLHVLIACPGFTASNIRNTALSKDGQIQQESPRDESKMMTAEKVAEYIYSSVIKRQNSLVLTINGKLTVLLNKLLPSLVDRLVYNHLKKEPNSPF